jgi:hypothetical protein
MLRDSMTVPPDGRRWLWLAILLGALWSVALVRLHAGRSAAAPAEAVDDRGP